MINEIETKKKSRIRYLMITTKVLLLTLAISSLCFPQVFLWIMRFSIFTMSILLLFGKQLRNLKNKVNANNKPD